MIDNAFNNTRRKTLDGYEFQEYVEGVGWEYSHTDIGYFVMLENKAAYADNQRLGGNPFRIIKRRLPKADHSLDAIERMEASDIKAKIERLQRLIDTRPDSNRNENRQWQIDQARRRLAVLN